jgi:hypothetical protein
MPKPPEWSVISMFLDKYGMQCASFPYFYIKPQFISGNKSLIKRFTHHLFKKQLLNKLKNKVLSEIRSKRKTSQNSYVTLLQGIRQWYPKLHVRRTNVPRVKHGAFVTECCITSVVSVFA